MSEEDKTEDQDLKSIPLLVIAGVWSAYNVVLSGTKQLNETRDKMIETAKRETHPAREIILRNNFSNDFVPLAIAQMVFCLLFAVVMVAVPVFVTKNKSFKVRPVEERKTLKLAVWALCGSATALAIAGVIAFWRGLVLDHSLLETVTSLKLDYF